MMRRDGSGVMVLLMTLASCSAKHRAFTDGVAGGSAVGDSVDAQGDIPGTTQGPPGSGRVGDEPSEAAQRDQEDDSTQPDDDLGSEGRNAVTATVATCAGLIDAGPCSGACDPTISNCTPGCPGCLIGGDCVAPSARNSVNACLVCDPALSTSDWSNDDGASCDDGQFCTVDDTCFAGACTGTARECEDAVDCNGVSQCDEDSDRCTDGQNECGGTALCDTVTGTCVSTCAGCVINGSCVPTGAPQVGNTCLVCDPGISVSRYSAAPGKVCGSGPGTCSLQDTCDDSGICQPNHSPSGTPCGSSASNQCDSPDTCDGNGGCLTRLTVNATPCNDGRFCTVGDECQGGVCTASGSRNCGTGQTCNENTDQCQCQGCIIGGSCVLPGVLDSNPCQVCDPGRSITSFSANAGAACGAGATECSAQDTCNAQGQCVPNHLPSQTPCTSPLGGQCQGDGRCAAPPRPAQLQATPAALDFGRVEVRQTSVAQSWSLSNIGGSSTNAFSLVGTGSSGDFPTNRTTCPALLPNQQCTIDVSFLPTAPGTRRATMNLVENSGSLSASLQVVGSGLERVFAGDSVPPLPDEGSQPGNALLAYGINIQNSATLVGFGIVTAQAQTRVRLGLYRSTGTVPFDRPSTRVAQTAATTLSNGRQEISIPAVEVTAGSYWLVTLFDAPTLLAQDFSVFVPTRNPNAANPFGNGLPEDFANVGTGILNGASPRINLYAVLLQ